MKMTKFTISILSSVFCALSFATAAVAAEPTLLGRVNGVVVHNTASFSAFQFEEGTRGTCERSQAGLDVTRCILTGSSVLLNGHDGAESAKITFEKMSHYTSTVGNQLLTQYVFAGVWKITQNGVEISSPASMTFLQYGEGAPSNLRGYVRVEQYNLSEQLTGTVVP